VASIKNQINRSHFYLVKHETFIEHPQASLESLCRFLAVEAITNNINDCSSVFFQTPHQSRHKMPWNAKLIKTVSEKSAQFPFIHGYSFENLYR
jgi:hypothetical protein